jgi:hypothetical protein
MLKKIIPIILVVAMLSGIGFAIYKKETAPKPKIGTIPEVNIGLYTQSDISYKYTKYDKDLTMQVKSAEPNDSGNYNLLIVSPEVDFVALDEGGPDAPEIKPTQVFNITMNSADYQNITDGGNLIKGYEMEVLEVVVPINPNDDELYSKLSKQQTEDSMAVLAIKDGKACFKFKYAKLKFSGSWIQDFSFSSAITNAKRIVNAGNSNRINTIFIPNTKSVDDYLTNFIKLNKDEKLVDIKPFSLSLDNAVIPEQPEIATDGNNDYESDEGNIITPSDVTTKDDDSLGNTTDSDDIGEGRTADDAESDESKYASADSVMSDKDN